MARHGRPLVVAWHDMDTEEALLRTYREELHSDVRDRLHALWLLRGGEWQMGEVASIISVAYRTVQRWVGRYRTGGTCRTREALIEHHRSVRSLVGQIEIPGLIEG